MRLLAALSAVLCAVLSAAPAAAQYPARPVRLVLSTPAGGPSDTAARALAQSLAKSLGQPVIVENKPGANGAIAVQAVMAAPPDGYTLLWGIASMATLDSDKFDSSQTIRVRRAGSGGVRQLLASANRICPRTDRRQPLTLVFAATAG